MFEIFTRASGDMRSSSLRVYPALRLIRNNLLININKVKNFFTNQVYRAPEISILETLIVNYCPSLKMDDFDFFMAVSNESDNWCRALGMSSILNIGKSFNNILSTGGDEFVIVRDSDFRLKTLVTEDDIKLFLSRITPLRYVYSNNLEYNLECRAKENVTTSEFTVYSLDPVELFVGYKYWAKLRSKYELDTRPFIYLTQVVNPNAIITELDLITINRIGWYARNGVEDNIERMRGNNYPFFMLDITTSMDKVIKDYVNFISNRKLSLEYYINTIPSLFSSGEVLEELKINYNTEITQTRWIKWLSRGPIMEVIVDLLGENGKSFNLKVLNTFKADYVNVKNNNTPVPGKSKIATNYINRTSENFREYIFGNAKF